MYKYSIVIQMIAGMIAKQHQIIAMRILWRSGRTEECYMEKMEKRIQEELFDVEVQYCNPDDCYLDCQDAANHCNYHFTTMF